MNTLAQPQRFYYSDSGSYRTPEYLLNPESVQVMYRPVLQLDKVPPVPEPEDVTSNASRWWAEEWRRCVEGWTAPDGNWINPIYYWYLNHVTIEMVDEQTAGDVIEPPLYCDSDRETFDLIYSCISFSFTSGLLSKNRIKGSGKERAKREKEDKKKELEAITSYAKELAKLGRHFVPGTDLIATKGRRKHWSYINLCGVFLWSFCVDANGHLGVGFDSKDTREEGQRIFRGAYDRLHTFWKHRELYTDREGELSACKYLTDDEGMVQKAEGYAIHFKEMDKRPGAFRGKRFRLLLLDEAGKYMNLGKILGSVRDCLRQGTFKFGTCLVGGTCDPITNKSEAYKNQWDRAPALGWVKHFIPAWKIASPDVDWFTGTSLRQRAEPKYLAERQEFIDAGDMEGYHLTVQENPLEEYELFMLPTLSLYPSHKLLEQTTRIAGLELGITGRTLLTRRGKLSPYLDSYDKPTGHYFFEDDENGPWLFHRDYTPRPDLPDIDVLGVDDVMKDKAQYSDSKCAMVLYRRFHHKVDQSDMVMGVYYARPALDVFVMEVEAVMRMTRCKTILEYNAKYVADHLIKAQLGDQLMWFNEEPGIRNSDNTIVNQTILALKWIGRAGLARTWFQQIVDGLKNWRQRNDDVASAFHLCMLADDVLTPDAIEEDAAKRMAIDPFRFGSDNTGFGMQEALVTSFEQGGLVPLWVTNPAWGGSVRWSESTTIGADVNESL